MHLALILWILPACFDISMDESTWHNWNVCCCLVFVVVVGLLLFCWFFFSVRDERKFGSHLSAWLTRIQKGKKPVFSCTAPCIMLKFCSLKFSDLQPVDHNRLRAAGFTTDAMPACSLQQINFISGQKHYWADHIAFFFFFFFLLFFLPCSENPQLDVFVQKDVPKLFLSFF